MPEDIKIHGFLSQYDLPVYNAALQLRKTILSKLPDIIEQIDLPAKMIAYCYGQKYIDMICTIIPSKKGLKLGFYKGNELSDPHHVLKGTGKISRYVEIKPGEAINLDVVKSLLNAALLAYRQRITK